VSVEHGSDRGIIAVDDLVEGVGEAVEEIGGSRRDMGDNIDVVSGILGALEFIDKPGELTVGVILHGLLIQPKIESVVEDRVQGDNAELATRIFDGVCTIFIRSVYT
jgi:hypothetical protein